MEPEAPGIGGKTCLCLTGDNTWRLVLVVGTRRSEQDKTEDFYVRYKESDPPHEEWVNRRRLVPLNGAEAKRTFGCNPDILERFGLMNTDKVARNNKKPRMLPSHTAQHDLPEELICPVCSDIFSDPVLLDCGHNFCRSCLSSIRANQRCPYCLKLLLGQRSLPNQALGRLALHTMETLMFNKRISETKNHLVEGETSQYDNYCPLEKSAESNSRSLHENVKKCREELSAAVTQLQASLQLQRARCTQQEQRINKHVETVRTLKKHLESQFAALQRFLLDREQALQRELEQEAEDSLRDMEQELHDLREQCQGMQETLDRAYRKMTQQDPSDFLMGVNLVTKRFCCPTSRCRMMQKMDDEQPFADLHSHILGKFRGPVQYAVWKDMRVVLDPDLSSPHLDPDTAHPDLLLSESRQSIIFSPGSSLSHPSPARFNQYLVALGIPRYKSGKHYWELEIGQNTECDLGVALESISRTNHFTLAPTDGCWVCSVRHGQRFIAFDSSIQVFMPQEKLQRIGVYLDYDRGQVSFYNADGMRHLYTFTSCFTGNLCAYVSPCCVTNAQCGSQLIRVNRNHL
ncbi:zinc-binding protein A33 [Bombina bombina]|uniref:zinc-binding protein A33 n=1 Tax=Bombina bombina TaxID=8345 RepID=UPI00235A6511|nr:zinc-binding protein A33 [Bombina bombina]